MRCEGVRGDEGVGGCGRRTVVTMRAGTSYW